MPSVVALERLKNVLSKFKAGECSSAELVAACRGETELLALLPPAFAEVMEGTLQRLESSGLFAEESCSFSQQGLIESIDLWIQKANKRVSGD